MGEQKVGFTLLVTATFGCNQTTDNFDPRTVLRKLLLQKTKQCRLIDASRIGTADQQIGPGGGEIGGGVRSGQQQIDQLSAFVAGRAVNERRYFLLRGNATGHREIDPPDPLVVVSGRGRTDGVVLPGLSQQIIDPGNHLLIVRF